MTPEKKEATQQEVDDYKEGRSGESNGSIISNPTEANVKGQQDKADADARKEEDSEKSDD